jgi:hypothetical protein
LASEYYERCISAVLANCWYGPSSQDVLGISHYDEVTACAPSHIVWWQNISILCDLSIIAGIIKNIKVVDVWES